MKALQISRHGDPARVEERTAHPHSPLSAGATTGLRCSAALCRRPGPFGLHSLSTEREPSLHLPRTVGSGGVGTHPRAEFSS